MKVLTLLSTLAPIAITIMLVIFAELSRRLGAVVKTAPLYRWFFVAAVLTFGSSVVRLLSIEFSQRDFEYSNGSEIAAYGYTLPLMAGLVIALWAAWRYWGWLVYAGDGDSPASQ
ncbi:MAG: hypothetical protein HY862_03345 [Chloroflexi bacterium]|nr:hypothetical protein [Chloroflexota bacterium]